MCFVLLSLIKLFPLSLKPVLFVDIDLLLDKFQFSLGIFSSHNDDNRVSLITLCFYTRLYVILN